MITADVRYGHSYAWAEGLGFRSVQHVIDHVREPWNYPPIYEPDNTYVGDLPNPGVAHEEIAGRGRSFWPVHGDWEPQEIVAFIYLDPDSDPADIAIEVGPKGGLRRIPL